MALGIRAIKLLRRVEKLILKEPLRIHMAHWMLRGNTRINQYVGLKIPDCGKVGCIGGWVEILYSGEKTGAGHILGLTEDQAKELFYASRLTHTTHAQSHRHAQAVVNHIERFIKKHKGR